jgi:predicted PurR-regulated permease PerM
MVISLFFAVAMEPAVTHLHKRRGMKRGAAIALVFGGLVLFVGGLIFVLIPGLVHAAGQIGEKLPHWIDQINKTFGVSIDHGKPPEQINADLQAAVQGWVQGNTAKLLGLASSTLGLLFELLTIATFTFYISAGAPQLFRAYLAHIPPSRQQRVGWAWDTAVVQTGGYFYSRALLMFLNAALFFLVSMLVGLNWAIALPLAAFEAFFAEFIPVIGTYVGAGVPIIVALGLRGLVPALVLLVWVTCYQGIENYFLSPRLTAKTMELNGGVAFGAALAGGAIGGPIGAFMALPVAASITAFIKQYSHKYPVVYRSAYDDDPAPGSADAPTAAAQAETRVRETQP